MTHLAIGLTANANMSAHGFAQLVGRADLKVRTGGGRAAVQHAKVSAAPLPLKPARAAVGVSQPGRIPFTTHSLPRCPTPSQLRPGRGLRRSVMGACRMQAIQLLTGGTER